MCFDNVYCDHEVVEIVEDVTITTCGDCNEIFWANEFVNEVDEERSNMVDDKIVKVWSACPTEVGRSPFQCYICDAVVFNGGFEVVADIYDIG